MPTKSQHGPHKDMFAGIAFLIGHSFFLILFFILQMNDCRMCGEKNSVLLLSMKSLFSNGSVDWV